MKIFKKLTIVLIVSFLFLAHNIAFVFCYKTKNLSKIDINWCFMPYFFNFATNFVVFLLDIIYFGIDFKIYIMYT